MADNSSVNEGQKQITPQQIAKDVNTAYLKVDDNLDYLKQTIKGYRGIIFQLLGMLTGQNKIETETKTKNDASKDA